MRIPTLPIIGRAQVSDSNDSQRACIVCFGISTYLCVHV